MHLVVNSVASALLADKRRDFTNNFEMRFIIWERSVQKKTDFWIVLCCILKEPKINMLEFSCWCKKNSQSIHEELHSIPLIFLNKKSEIWNDFTIFEKWKVKNFLPSLFSRSESENQMTQNRDREVNFQKNSREFSRIETLAGHCLAVTSVHHKSWLDCYGFKDFKTGSYIHIQTGGDIHQ